MARYTYEEEIGPHGFPDVYARIETDNPILLNLIVQAIIKTHEEWRYGKSDGT